MGESSRLMLHGNYSFASLLLRRQVSVDCRVFVRLDCLQKEGPHHRPRDGDGFVTIYCRLVHSDQTNRVTP